MSTSIATINSMRGALSSFRNSTPRNTGATGFLKFSKGDWSFGKSDEAIDPDGAWIIHPQSLMHGWICWRDGKLFKETLVPFTQTLPAETSMPEAPEPSPDSDDQPGYQLQMSMQVVAVEGKQAGTQLTFKTATVGGRSAMDALVDEVLARMDDVEATGEGGVYPVVQFSVDSYKHKTRGKIFVPLISVVGWSTNEPDAEIEWVDGEAPEPVPAPTPVKRIRRPASA